MSRCDCCLLAGQRKLFSSDTSRPNEMLEWPTIFLCALQVLSNLARKNCVVALEQVRGG